MIRGRLAISFLVIAGTLFPGVAMAQVDLPDDQLIAEAGLMLRRGDSLLQADKPVAALAMYTGAAERSLDPCQGARASVGIARIYVDSENPELASASLQTAHAGFLACESEVRREQVIKAADLWLQLHQESRAIELIQHELNLRDDDTELASKLADLWFTAGMWSEAQSQYHFCLNTGAAEDHAGRTAWLSALIQLAGLQSQTVPDSLVKAFDSEAVFLEPQIAQGHREQIHLVLTMEGLHVQALHWAKEILEHTTSNDPAARAVAHLRVANSAMQSHRPLDALIGFHDATKSARQTEDLALLGEVLRQKGLFEHERGNDKEALEAFLELDAINMERLVNSARTAGANKELRQFNEQVMPELDPFEQAVLDVQRSQHSPYQSSGWPWIAALLGIGVLAYARTQKQLKSALRKERRRIIRLRSLVPSDRLPATPQPISTPAVEALDESDLGSSSLMPNGAWVFTRDVDPRSLSIQAFLHDLDADLLARIQPEIGEDVQLSIGPEVRVAIRNLLRGFAEITSADAPIVLKIGALEKAHWQLSLDSRHTGASKALEGLFYGKDALASSRWNELHAQLRKLAGKINVERLSPLEERLTVTLPYL